MHTFSDEYSKLIKDTICILRQNKEEYIFSSDYEYFQEEIKAVLPKKKEEIIVNFNNSSPYSSYNENKIKKKAEYPLKKKEIIELVLEKEEEKKEPVKTIKLEQIQIEHHFDDNIKQLLEKISPDTKYIENIPSDTTAKKISNAWKYKSQAKEICILSFSENINDKQFLRNLAQAIDISFKETNVISSKEIEINDNWHNFLSNNIIKLIIVKEDDLMKNSNLLCHLKEIPNKSEKYLLNIPIFILPDLALYRKNPKLKNNLWKAISHKINRLNIEK